MTLIQCIKKAVLPVVAVLFTTASHAQITSGKIVFERRTNLKKTMGDNPRFKQFINDKFLNIKYVPVGKLYKFNRNLKKLVTL